jgi:hypothetical protein
LTVIMFPGKETRTERNDDAVLFLSRVDYARLQSFIALHPGVADAIGMTHCHQRGHLEYPIVVVLTPGVDSAMN